MDLDDRNLEEEDRSGYQRSQSRAMVLPAWWQVREHTHAPALDVVTDGGDVNVHVPRGTGPPPVLLVKGFLIVHVSFHVIRENTAVIFRVSTRNAPLWLHHFWTKEKRSHRNQF